MTEENGMENGRDPIVPSMGSPVPEMTSRDEKMEFKLPIGSVDLSNELYRTVLLGPLDGTVRKKIGRPDILANPGRVVTTALVELLEFSHFKFNDKKAENKLMIRSMYSGDRAACVLRIRELTKKQTPIIQNLDCPHCSAPLQVHTSPAEIETIPVEETDYKFEEGEWLLTVSAEGHTARFRLARGFEEEGLSREQIQNINESAYAIVTAACKDFDGQPVDADFFEHLDIGIFDEFLGRFIENQPGPDTTNSLACSTCSRTFEFAVDPSDFLLPTAGLRRFGRRGRRSGQ